MGDSRQSLVRRPPSWEADPLTREYISDWGNRLIIEERPAGHAAASERALRETFDAR